MSTQTRRDYTIEIIVGVFAFIVLFLLGTFTIILSSQNIFKKYVDLEIVFDDVMGLGAGDSVQVRGLQVGKVKSLALFPDGVHVFASLEGTIKLREDYRISIEPGSVLGGTFLSIYEGEETSPELSEGAKLYGMPPIDFLEEASDTIQSVRSALDEGGILDNLKVTMEEFKVVATRMSKGEGTLGKLMVDDTVYSDLKDITANLKELSDRLADGQGTIGQLLSEDDTLYHNLNAAAEAIADIATSISNGEGTLGKLTQDEDLYEELQALITEVRATVDDFRETAPITSFSSIFFGAF
jgi:phospholipid/cholesterol/gamma-HCH transport system substrate-binding protein